MEDIFHVLRHKHIVSIFLLLTFLTITGTVIFSFIEGWTPIQSLYFTVSTMTTVGYGDLTPTHDTSRFIATIYMIVMVPVMLVAVGVAADTVYNYREKKKK